MLKTSDLKVTFLGINPVLKDETGILDSETIVALSALLTFKGKSVQALLRDAVEQGQDIKEKIKKILRKSSLKGHASMATTPVLCFSFEASKFLDSALSGIVFSSSLMASGRRTDTTCEDIVYPLSIIDNERAKEIYKTASEKNIDFVSKVLSEGAPKDEASKMLQYGIYGTGIVQYPIESIVALKKEYEANSEWMPEEVGFLLSVIEAELKRCGLESLYATRLAAARTTFIFPNIFKDPTESNIVRELTSQKKTDDIFEIVSADLLITEGLKQELAKLMERIKNAVQNKEVLKKEWPQLLSLRRQIISRYNNALDIKILSSVAWRVWGEKKRHRTVPMAVESVYYLADKAEKILASFVEKIKEKNLSPADIEEIHKIFYIPQSFKNNNNLLHAYIERASDSLLTYKNLLGLGIKSRDALFVVPRALKIDVLQNYDLYNLLAGYYPLRICQTAEQELRHLTIKEEAAIRHMLKNKNLDWLAEMMGPKCHATGFCLEEKSCAMIKSLVPNYDETFHEEMKKDLEEKFINNLKTLEA